MTRVFLMKWYHYTVEEFEDLTNVEHCKFIIMRRNERGKYDLETKLRTWTEYEKQQEEAAKNNPEIAAQRAAKQKKFQSMRKKWGGCPDGCTHNEQSWNQPNAHVHNHMRTGSIAAIIDRDDKGVIEKAMASNLCSNCGGDMPITRTRSKKSNRPIVRVEPPTADTSSDDESSRMGSSSDGKLHSGLIRGRDGGGSKSGFNSDYEAEDEIDSEREKREISEANQKMFKSKAERLGDMKSDSDWSRSPQDSDGNGGSIFKRGRSTPM
ncbi:hypothetical protein TWF694_010544 [Orbilia ellipsospora]|uniref:Uncharacterized protein n=1 Tax=Orbilia ellipsospora TaxID=2528407 RepID=A0AAV9XAJ6_9PEZI